MINSIGNPVGAGDELEVSVTQEAAGGSPDTVTGSAVVLVESGAFC
ncbi:MAG: hypothetical protein ACRD5H_08290 [Nitrososphaerales archaeon]